MTDYRKLAEQYKFQLDIVRKQLEITEKAHRDLLNVLANPDKYLADNIEENNEL